MIKSKFFWASAAAAAMSVSAASAASLSSGFYAGLNIGYDIGKTATSTSVDASGTYFVASDVVDIVAAGPFDLNRNGVNGGAQVGYNWISGMWGAGLEADFAYMGRSDSQSVTAGYSCCFPTTFTSSLSMQRDWLSTFRARVGMDIGGTFLYGTGGLALGDVGLGLTFSDTFTPLAPASFSVSSTELGWTGGGGIETTFAPNLSAKLEYLYVDLGSQTVAGIVAGDEPIIGTANFTQHLARFGINYHF